MFGRPPPFIWELKGNLLQKGGVEVWWQLEQLGKVIYDITPYVQERIPFSLGTTIHPYSPGDLVWVKDWKWQTPSPTWKGPCTIVLTTPTAVKVAGITPWIHHTQLKTAAEEKGHWTTHTNPEEPLKTRLIFC